MIDTKIPKEIVSTPSDENVILKWVAGDVAVLGILKREQITEAVFDQALLTSSDALKYVKDPTKEEIIKSLKKDASTLQYVKEEEQTHDVCVMSIVRHPRNLRHVINQTDALCLLAIQLNYHAFSYVHEKSEFLALEAIKIDGRAATFLNHDNFNYDFYLKCARIQGDVLQHIPFKYLNEEICQAAVAHKWEALALIPLEILTEKMVITAYEQNPLALRIFMSTIGFFRFTNATGFDARRPPLCKFDLDPNVIENQLVYSFDRSRQMSRSIHLSKDALEHNPNHTKNRRRRDIL